MSKPPSTHVAVAEFSDGFTLALAEDNWMEYLQDECIRLRRIPPVRVTFFDWVLEPRGFCALPRVREVLYV